MNEEIKEFLKEFEGTTEFFNYYKIIKDPSVLLEMDNIKKYTDLISFLLLYDEFLDHLTNEVIDKLVTLNLSKEDKRALELERKILYLRKEKKYFIKKDTLNRVRNDNYESPETCLLYQRPYDEKNELFYMDTLICSNTFNDIITDNLDIINNKKILNTISDIIYNSIRVKTHDFEENYVYYRLDDNQIKNYDYINANKLLTSVEKKKSKILEFKKDN